MGSEALAKQTRRDIRRAFAPEASAELLRFIETVRKDQADQLAMSHGALSNRISDHSANVEKALTAMAQHLERRIDRFQQATFLQRPRWIVTGR